MSRIVCWFVLLLPLGSLAAVAPNPSITSQPNFRGDKEIGLANGQVNLVKYQPLEEADVAMECESTVAPEALATPHGALTAIPDNSRIVVNFIIGTDGQVYSPFVLDGAASLALQRQLVEEVRHWHYRPAMCNGVPTDAEVKVQLSSR